VEHFLLSWGYLALFIATLLSSMCIPVGSEVAIAYGGALASGHLTATDHDHLNLVVVVAVATAGELVGSAIGYALGRFGGRPLLDRFGKYLLLTNRDLDRAEAWLHGRGEAFALIGRFVPLVRSFVSLAAGLADMSIGIFAIFAVLGCGAWCAGLASIGYSLGGSWHHVVTAFNDAGYIAVAAVVLVVLAAFWHRFRTLRAERMSAAPLAPEGRATAGPGSAFAASAAQSRFGTQSPPTPQSRPATQSAPATVRRDASP
jgi:membrane protein DedA with SNARE-associated domain